MRRFRQCHRSCIPHKELNKQFKAANAPILAKLEGKNLKLTHTKYGEHHITNISGDAKRYLFFQENSFFDEEQKINIMPSDNSNDKIVIDKPAVNTATLGIHSVIITNRIFSGRYSDGIMFSVRIK